MLDDGVQLDGIAEGFEVGAEVGCACGDDFFRDGVGGEEGAEAQQVGGGAAGCFDLLKGEVPGGGDGFVVVGVGRVVFEQCTTLFVVALQVAVQAAGGLVDVGGGLFEGEGEAVEFVDDFQGFCALCWRGLLDGRVVGQEAGAVEQEERAL